MVRGRKPKPTNTKVIEGNPGKRPLNDNEPQMPFGATCPDWLSDYAKEEWALVAPGLEANQLLTIADRATFAAYCDAVGSFREALEMISEFGLIVSTENGFTTSPYVHQKNNAQRLMLSFGSDFGLTPASRSRISVPEKTDDGLDALLGGTPN